MRDSNGVIDGYVLAGQLLGAGLALSLRPGQRPIKLGERASAGRLAPILYLYEVVAERSLHDRADLAGLEGQRGGTVQYHHDVALSARRVPCRPSVCNRALGCAMEPLT